MVLCRNASAGIDHKDHHIGLGDCLLSLFGHFFVDAIMGIGFKAARIYDNVFVTTLPTLPIVAIARETRKVSDDGIAAFGESIE
jgi:hypothetical protein